jgi:molybdopterin-guanine dinucleotide biosynthesis protein A
MRPGGDDEGGRGSVAGVVLAGGRSRRFGRDKLKEPYRGRPLLHHAVERLLDVCDEVVVVLAPDADEPSIPTGVDVRFVRDAVQGEGPLAGALTGLRAVAEGWAVLAGGDMPDLQPGVLREMLRAGRETGVVAVTLSDGGKERPLPCALRTGPAAGAVDTLLRRGRRSLRDLLAAVATVVVDEPTWTALDPERRTLFDVDEPGDVDR